jgi:MFS family permease
MMGLLEDDKAGRSRAARAMHVIVLFGIVSLFGDMLYEGARSANGQYLELLGVSATLLGLVYGLGEFLGYALRLVSGYISDRTGRQWAFIFMGYATLIVVPLMGLTANWQIIIILILLERIGKGLRSPPKDTILSQVAEQGGTGMGRAFGIQEALDQIGAFSGPLVFSLAFYISGQQGITDYQIGYLSLFIAFVLLLIALALVFSRYKGYSLNVEPPVLNTGSEVLTRNFWMFTLFASLTTMGLVNFSLIGYYLKAESILPDTEIVMLYSMAMIVDAAVALCIGSLYDRMKARSGRKSGGISVLVAVPVLTAAIPFLGFAGTAAGAIIGMVLFGAVMGAHETVMRSAIADITPFRKRGTAYGIFYTAYGISFLIGSSAMGIIYDHFETIDIGMAVVVIEILALIVFIWMRSDIRKNAIVPA